MKQPLLSVRDLSVRFAIHGSTLEAVRGVSFDVWHGQSVALVGESGSGKSVVAKSIMGLLPPNASITGGEIQFQLPATPKADARRVDIAKLDPRSKAMRSLRGRTISLIFQEPMVSLSPLHTIGDQVSEALFLHRDLDRATGMQLTQDMLGLVGLVDPQRALKAYPFELSGGMRQRAMIAMALICRPALLIADEPTTALDVTIQAQILKLIKQLQAQLNMAVLMITHDLGVVANVVDEVVVVYHGEVMESGPLRAVFSSPQHAYTKALLHAVPGFDMPPQQRLTPLRAIKIESGEFMRARRQQAAQQAAQPARQPAGSNAATPAADDVILSVTDLSKSFGARSHAWSWRAEPPRVHALRQVSFALRCGESLGLVGESGSGKSTLGKLLVQAMRPDSGSIVFNGSQCRYDVVNLEGQELLDYRRRVQYIFQDPVGSLNPSMTLFDIIREPMQIHALGDSDYQIEVCTELMRLVGLQPKHLRRYPHSFSGGQRQRIGIARALVLQPDLLICDEPVSALDVSIQAQILNLMKDLQQELGLSYLFISHNLAVVDYIADRIAVMYRGEIVELAPSKSLFAHPTHPYTRCLLQAIPVTDLERPLDFSLLAEPSAATHAAPAWPAPFAVDAVGVDAAAVDAAAAPILPLHEILPQHFVRAHTKPAVQNRF